MTDAPELRASSVRRSARAGIRPARPIHGAIVVLAFLGSIGVALVLCSTVHDQLAFERSAQAAEGRVIALQERPSKGRGHGTTYLPVYRYVASDGRTIDAVSEDGRGSPVWAVGDTSRLLYDPANPLHVTTDTPWGRWGTSLVLLVLMLIWVAGGVVGLRTRAGRLF